MLFNSTNAQTAWVIPEQLRTAREALRLSLEEAAEKIEVSVTELSEWEVGRGNPTLPHLRRISMVYRRPARFFFVAEELRPITDYRLVTRERPAVLGTEALTALIDFQDLCRRSWELEQILEISSEPRLGQAQLSEDADEVAARERKSLEQVGLKLRMPPRSKSTPREVFQEYRRAIERLGVKVFCLPMPVAEVRGASWWHPEYGPAILVSRSDWMAPRLFTLAHEFAHVLLHEEGTPLCDMKGVAQAEKFANRFSAGLLVPADAFWDTLRSRGWTDRADWDEAALRSLASTFKVSRDVIAIRLEELELTPPGFYGSKRWQWDQQLTLLPWRPRGRRRPGWRIHTEDVLGPRYEELVLNVLGEGRLTGADLTRYLGLRIREVDEWLAYRAALRSSEHRNP